MALFAKITPARIEGTMFAFLTGTSNFDSGVMQPMLGTFINNQFVGVNKDDQSRYSTLCLIGFFCSFFGFAIAFMIPLKETIQKDQFNRELTDKFDNYLRKKRRDARREKR